MLFPAPTHGPQVGSDEMPAAVKAPQQSKLAASDFSATRQSAGSAWLRRRGSPARSPPSSRSRAPMPQRSCGSRAPAAAESDARRPLAGWVRRFRRDPPLPREERRPYTLHAGDEGAPRERALQRELERSADALLDEAQRAIACLDSAPALLVGHLKTAAAPPADSAALGRLAPGAHTRESPLPAAPVPSRSAAAESVGHEAWQGAKTSISGDSGRGLATLRSPAAAGQHPADGGGTGIGDDGEDLLERWRRSRRAQQVCALLPPQSGILWFMTWC